jgi:hypothetical protein
MSVDLCGCSHANDHVGRPCSHEAPEGSNLPKCPCPVGMRSDIALLRQTSQLAIGIQQLNTNVFKLLALVQASTGREVVLTRDDKGNVEVSIRSMQASAGILMP